MPRAVLLPLAALAVLAAGCDRDEAPEIATGEVTRGEVVQTVVAAATLEPAGRTSVAAPAAGRVVELLVEDGDVVASGDLLLRLSSDTLEQQLAQAELAVEAADQLAGFPGGAGLDLAPLLGAFREQFTSVLPAFLDGLAAQVDAAEAALTAALEAAAAAAAGSDVVGQLDEDEAVRRADEAVQQAAEAAERARAQLAEVEAAVARTARDLASAEAAARSQAAAAAAGQAAAVDAQREQAELALEAVRSRLAALTVTAPAGGVVELTRGAGGAPGLPDITGLVDGFGGGDLAGVDPGGVLGAPGGSAVTSTGPVAAGDAVTAGQPLVTIYDLTSFTVVARVDEIDVVEVEVGQPVTVLVDAYPEAEFRGVVERIAIEPERGVTGGASYPVTIRLEEVPAEVRLRVGLTASVEIEVRRVVDALVVPTSALLRRAGAEVVYAVRDGVAVEIPAVVVALGDDTAALDAPLEPGELVVTTGVELVADGDRIEP